MIPSELIIEPTKFENTSNPHVLKPVYGSMKGVTAQFCIHDEYSGSASEKEGIEVRRPVELCMIRTDKFSNIPLRMNELSPQQKIDLASLYERFKKQASSTETNVLEWDAVSDQERVHLGSLGCWTVEQLYNTPKEERYKFGPGGDDLWNRADRHMKAKGKDPASEQRKELDLVLEENKKLSARMKELEEKYFAEQMKRAEVEKSDSLMDSVMSDMEKK